MARQTPLYAEHLACGARMVDFSGWNMPVNYGSQIEEHHAVRREAGMFDVSHMRALDLSGNGATQWLRSLLANDVAKLAPTGKALYSCMLNEQAGVLDDLIVYRFEENGYRIVVNAGTADKDVAWMRQHIATTDAEVSLLPREDLAMIAVQGPQAIELACTALANDLRDETMIPAVFHARYVADMLVARTGYTGEDGLELTLPAACAPAVWKALQQAGVCPAGLGARDTLRLEAGMNLYGQDMDETVSPLDAGLAWTVDLKDESRDFVGRAALAAQPQLWQMLGLVLDGKGVLRAHMQVACAQGQGEISSGTFSPTLGCAIAMARLPMGVTPGADVEVDIRGKNVAAHVVSLPFVRKGKILV